jgi:hypothetical protein
MKHLALLTLPLAMVLAACNSEPKPAETAAPAPAAVPAATPASTAPSIAFAEPADGATVTSPVKLKFTAQNFTIAAVPEGEVTTVRPNTGHYHLAIDTECMAPGIAIPKGVNWIHYGKGDTEVETQLSPGTHKLTLAIGDDKHVTIEGLCKTITVNVASAAAK